MMKKGLLVTMIALFLISLPAIVAFAPALAQKSKPTKVLQLSFSETSPAKAPLCMIHQEWANRVEKQSGGRVKINFYFSQSLLKASESFRGVQTGQADITYYIVGLDWGLMPLNMITKLGFMGYPSMKAGTEIYHKIWDKFPEIREELKGVKVLSSRMTSGNQLSFTKKPVRVPMDIKGMKVISIGGSFATEMAAMGAAPMDLKVGDMYMSLDRGLAEGISTVMPVLFFFRILKLVPYHTMFENGTSMNAEMILMNPKTWNSLPGDIQKIIEDLEPWLEEKLIKMNLGAEAMVKKAATEMKHTFIYPRPDEMQLWTDAVQSIHKKWIEDNEAKGLPARAIYEEVQRLIKEY